MCNNCQVRKKGEISGKRLLADRLGKWVPSELQTSSLTPIHLFI